MRRQASAGYHSRGLWLRIAGDWVRRHHAVNIPRSPQLTCRYCPSDAKGDERPCPLRSGTRARVLMAFMERSQAPFGCWLVYFTRVLGHVPLCERRPAYFRPDLLSTSLVV